MGEIVSEAMSAVVKSRARIIIAGAMLSLLLSGCERGNPELADLSEVPGGLAILDLTKEQAAEIAEWEQQLETVPDADEYAEFIESVLRRDQRSIFRSIASGDGARIAPLKIAKLETAAERYRADCGAYPAMAEALSQDPGLPGWQGPYFSEILDPWGIPFQFEVIDGKLEIRSFGPDRISKNDDDITN